MAKRELIRGIKKTEHEQNKKLLATLKPGLESKLTCKVNSLEITDKLVTENKLTPLMTTHNMHDTIAYGNRLIMKHEVRIAVEASGE